MGELLIFLGKAIVISLSGVLAPGALTAATIAAGTRHRHAGAAVAVGHGIVELPLVVLIVLGVGELLTITGVKIAIGLAGGTFLLIVAVGLIQTVRRPDPSAQSAGAARSPLLTGIILSAANPYFLVWWATVGLALATEAVSLGIMAFALFAAIHWTLDLIWLELLSQAAFRGTRLISPRAQRIVLALCAVALLYFGASFLLDAGAKLLQQLGLE